MSSQSAEGPAAATAADGGAGAVAAAAEVPPPPPPPPQLVVDRAPGMLQAVETSTSAISLQWAPVSCTLQSPASVVVEWNLTYELQMQQERSGVGGGRALRAGESVRSSGGGS